MSNVQKLAGDVVHDLRSRGLLPVVILLGIGLVAAPMLIGRGGSDGSVPPPAASIPGTGTEGSMNEPAVLTYNPGVRNYRERLKDLQQKDPFVQQFTNAGESLSDSSGAAATAASVGGGASAGGTAGTSLGDIGGGGGSTPPTSGGDTTGDTGGTTGGGKTGKAGKTKRFYYFRETDVLVGDATTAAQRRNRVPVLSFLPSEQVPVFIYLGASQDGKKAVFMVADDATPIGGAEFCVPSPTQCDVLAMEKGQTATVDNATDGKTYSLKVLDVRLVRRKKPPTG